MLNEEIISRAMKTDPAQVGHYIESGFMHPRIKPVDEGFKVIGPAFTIRLPGNDNAMLYYAMQKAPKGSVIVIDRMGESRYACCGEIVALAAKSLGLAGMVIDGPATDTLRIKEIGLPIFTTGRSAVTNTLQGINGEFGIAINCGGAVVKPGDIIFGDVDGVIVCPPELFEELLAKAEAADATEVLWKKNFEEGGYMTDFFDFENAIKTDTKALLGNLMKKK